MKLQLDELTGAYGREEFYRDKAKSTECKFLVCDGKNITEINKTEGREAGDEILCEIVRRLAEAYPKVYRLNGDMFAVLVNEEREVALEDIAHVSVAETLNEALRRVKEVS